MWISWFVACGFWRATAAPALVPVAEGFAQPTEVRFEPGQPGVVWVAEKEGRLLAHDLRSGARRTVAEVAVTSRSEMGLLGVAFHPRFSENGRFFLSYNPASEPMRSRIEAWRRTPTGAVAEHVVLELEQPYPNHNGGQIHFGPDGMLYVAFGDGGAAGDPHGYGQATHTWLGKILRVDVETAPYAVPSDNPGAPWRPEVWVAGVRNPWRFAVAADGRLIVADVGQDRVEEVSFAGRGDNLGWRVREGDRCFDPTGGCPQARFVDPWLVVNHPDGASITGGYPYTGASPALRGRYLYADFVTGWIRAAKLPPAAPDPLEIAAAGAGNWSTFGVDPAGEHYVADFAGGVIYRIAP